MGIIGLRQGDGESGAGGGAGLVGKLAAELSGEGGDP